ncbi:MAG: dephospho-CoA kinase [Bacteroides sp.]|nr:dephospho-CoA kinase [Bacteroides sp.]
MIRIGITGGIGSGKSVVCRLLEVRGIPVYDSDTAAKKLMLTDPEIRRGLISLLGEEVYKEGQLNKPLLSSFLFSDPEHAATINHLVHPVVRTDFRRWAAARRNCFFIAMESAILIESGFATEVDKVVDVYAPLPLRLKRVMERDGSTEEQVMQRIHSQMDDEQKQKIADIILRNDEERSLIVQVEHMLREFSGIGEY